MKTVFVTGASRGIGKSIALELGKDYQVIVGFSNSKDKADEVVEEIKKLGGEIAVFTAVGAGLAWGACAVRLGDRVTPINKSDAKLPDFDGTATDTIKRAIEYQVPDKLDKI